MRDERGLQCDIMVTLPQITDLSVEAHTTLLSISTLYSIMCNLYENLIHFNLQLIGNFVMARQGVGSNVITLTFSLKVKGHIQNPPFSSFIGSS